MLSHCALPCSASGLCPGTSGCTWYSYMRDEPGIERASWRSPCVVPNYVTSPPKADFEAASWADFMLHLGRYYTALTVYRESQRDTGMSSLPFRLER